MSTRRILPFVVFAAAAAIVVPVAQAGPTPVPVPAPVGVLGPPISVSAGPPGLVLPLTSGWHYNQNTGIDVIGTKLNVNAILVIGFSESYTGNAAAHVFDADGIINWYTPPQPWWGNYSGTQLSAGFSGMNLSLPNGDQVCAEWVGPGAPLGRPCVQIHN